jgi:hypothetical protein
MGRMHLLTFVVEFQQLAQFFGERLDVGDETIVR